jgi:hypothetical protein
MFLRLIVQGWAPEGEGKGGVGWDGWWIGLAILLLCAANVPLLNAYVPGLTVQDFGVT